MARRRKEKGNEKTEDEQVRELIEMMNTDTGYADELVARGVFYVTLPRRKDLSSRDCEQGRRETND